MPPTVDIILDGGRKTLVISMAYGIGVLGKEGNTRERRKQRWYNRSQSMRIIEPVMTKRTGIPCGSHLSMDSSAFEEIPGNVKCHEHSDGNSAR